MTEAEWLTATDPIDMITLTRRGQRTADWFQAAHAIVSSERKLRLYGCGCFRRTFERLVYAADRQVVDAAELYADGQLSLDALAVAARKCGATASLVAHPQAERVAQFDFGSRARGDHPAGTRTPVTNATRCDLLRCVFGNPFRPVAAAPAWLTSAVVTLAAAIYADRAFDRLPVLADALEEAGCDHADVLAHCRGDGPHARGCWVVDLVLGRE